MESKEKRSHKIVAEKLKIEHYFIVNSINKKTEDFELRKNQLEKSGSNYQK